MLFDNNSAEYNNKEHHDEMNLGWSDYGARWYDPQVGRWWSADPLAEKNHSDSPFNYVHNNPIKFIDPDGRDNVIYVVALKGSEKYIDVNKVIEEANIHLYNLGVKTRAVLYTGDYQKLNGKDKTDAVAVIGETATQSAEFIRKYVGDWLSNRYRGFSLDEFIRNDNIPEMSENFAGSGHTIAIAANRLSKFMTSRYNWNTEANPSAGACIFHGAGHNAGLNHEGDVPPFMFHADEIGKILQDEYRLGTSCKNTIYDLSTFFPSIMPENYSLEDQKEICNSAIIKQWIGRFGDNIPNPKLLK